MSSFNWVCPFCEHASTIVDGRIKFETNVLDVNNSTGNHALASWFIVCPNADCQKYTLTVALRETTQFPNGQRRVISEDKTIGRWTLVPWGAARTFPDFVPVAIREDYSEACAIVDLSPKAAATLARRAVQGIIREYWKIVKATLNQELTELKTLIGSSVTQETWDSIDAVRTIGNIGAHMEKDINLIVEVDPDEARLLITLVETLIDDTYIARHQREEHRAKLLALKARTQADRNKLAAPSAAPAGTRKP